MGFQKSYNYKLMKSILISGSAGAGKDTIIEQLYRDLQAQNIKVEKAWFYKTRKPRPGEDPNSPEWITREEFERKLANNELVFPGENAGEKVAYGKDWFRKSADVLIFNIMPSAVEKLKELSVTAGGQAYSISVDAPRQQRLERVRHRENYLIYEPAEYKLENDIAKEYNKSDFDLVIENPDGEFEKTYENIFNHVKEFLKKDEEK